MAPRGRRIPSIFLYSVLYMAPRGRGIPSILLYSVIYMAQRRREIPSSFLSSFHTWRHAWERGIPLSSHSFIISLFSPHMAPKGREIPLIIFLFVLFALKGGKLILLFSTCFSTRRQIPYLSEFRTWPEFRPVLGCFTFCGVTSRCVTILMMLKCLKMLKINLNSNIYSYFNILRFLYFLKII